MIGFRVLTPPSRLVSLALLVALSSCVPEGPPTVDLAGNHGNGTQLPVVHAKPAVAATGTIGAVFEDAFERAELGPDWNALGPSWKITSGKLCGKGARNKGVWLLRKLPVNARIEFDAFAESADGDLKAELWGDGLTGATGASYVNATSYLTILGGWKNTKHVLARLNEHATDRQELDVDPNSDDERARAISVGQPYHFKVERSDGKKVEWSVNGLLFFQLADAEPLAGPGHDHMGFNDWDTPVCFDNLKVTPL